MRGRSGEGEVSASGETKGRLTFGGIVLRILFLPLLLVLLELGFALAGIDPPKEGLPYQVLETPLFELEERAGEEWFIAHEPRLGSQTFRATKPADVVRIFFLGGSAVRGLGFSPNVSIPHYLENYLGQWESAGKRFEVINGGIVGISSDQVHAMSEEILARYAPDLVIVCSGNNEFLWLHAKSYRDLHDTGWLAPIGRAARRLRSYDFVRTHLFRKATGLGAAARDELRLSASELIEEVRLTEAQVSERLEVYGRNLTSIAAQCQQRDVPLILLTVPCNLRWNDPYPGEDWTADYLVEQGLDLAALPADRMEQLKLVREQVESALAAAPKQERFGLTYLRAKCLEESGDERGARSGYLAAVDEELHRRRASVAMNDKVRAAVSTKQLLDTVALLAERQSIPDFRFFYDHIHYAPEGASVLAVDLIEKLMKLKLFGLAAAEGEPLWTLHERAMQALNERLQLGEDFPEVDDWIGFNFDPAMVADRDLWKYDRALASLRELLAREPVGDPRKRGKALVYSGNALFFEANRGQEARRSYEEALGLVPEWEAAIRANLVKLNARWGEG